MYAFGKLLVVLELQPWGRASMYWKSLCVPGRAAQRSRVSAPRSMPMPTPLRVSGIGPSHIFLLVLRFGFALGLALGPQVLHRAAFGAAAA